MSKAKPSAPTFTVTLNDESYPVGNAESTPTKNGKLAIGYRGAAAAANVCGGAQLEIKESAFSGFLVPVATSRTSLRGSPRPTR